MSEEVRMILQMLQEGKLTVEQAERLLAALGREPEETRTGAAGEAAGPGPDEGKEDEESSWDWVSQIQSHIEEEVGRATAEAKRALRHAMREVHRATAEARRAREHARRNVCQFFQEFRCRDE